MGKDTTIGHWEIAGVESPRPLPTYPDGFPQALIREFEQRTGRAVICNKPYSGTEVLKDYGEEHMRTGAISYIPLLILCFKLPRMKALYRRSSFMNTAALRAAC